MKFCIICKTPYDKEKFKKKKSCCDLCLLIRKKNANKKFKEGHDIYFHECLGMKKCRNNNGHAMAYRGKIIFIDMKQLYQQYSFEEEVIPRLVNIISHEFLHILLYKEQGAFISYWMNRSKILKTLKQYFGGIETPTPDIMEADTYIERELKRIKERK